MGMLRATGTSALSLSSRLLSISPTLPGVMLMPNPIKKIRMLLESGTEMSKRHR
jgi:hypothetical protein